MIECSLYSAEVREEAYLHTYRSGFNNQAYQHYRNVTFVGVNYFEAHTHDG